MKLGILGGIGPESTGIFYLRLIRYLQKSSKPKDNTEYPTIVINSAALPELITNSSDETLRKYEAELQVLKQAGCDLIAIVCNTANSFRDRFERKTGVPILDLRMAVKEYLDKKRIRSLLLLASPTTLKDGYFHFPTISTVQPGKKEVIALGGIIARYNLGEKRKSDFLWLKSVVNKRLPKGGFVLAGCSEIALLLQKDRRAIDPMDILAKKCVEMYDKAT